MQNTNTHEWVSLCVARKKVLAHDPVVTRKPAYDTVTRHAYIATSRSRPGGIVGGQCSPGIKFGRHLLRQGGGVKDQRSRAQTLPSHRPRVMQKGCECRSILSATPNNALKLQLKRTHSTWQRQHELHIRRAAHSRFSPPQPLHERVPANNARGLTGHKNTDLRPVNSGGWALVAAAA
jgi:hypothetical protein